MPKWLSIPPSAYFLLIYLRLHDLFSLFLCSGLLGGVWDRYCTYMFSALGGEWGGSAELDYGVLLPGLFDNSFFRQGVSCRGGFLGMIVHRMEEQTRVGGGSLLLICRTSDYDIFGVDDHHFR